MSRFRALLLMAVVVALAAPGPANAHLRTGTTAVDYTATVSSPGSTGAFSVGLYASDLAVHLATHGLHTVVVIGYVGEPFLRIDRRGVAVNTTSPTAAASGLLRNPSPPSMREGRWRFTSGARSAVWHDARVSAPAPGSRSAVWHIPILLDGQRTRIVGETRRFERPAVWVWLVLLLPVPAFIVLLRRLCRDTLDRPCVLAGGVAATAALVLSAGFVLDPYASAGTWIAAADEAAFLAAAAAAAAWAPHRFRPLGGTGLGLVALATGLSKGAVFAHAVVLSLLPGTLVRALVFVAVAAGAVAIGLGPVHLLSDAFAGADRLPGTSAGEDV